MISFDDFQKVEMKVAEIVGVEDIEGKDKLYKLKANLGSEERTFVAGIKQDYSKEELQGKKIVVVANLEPAKIAGIDSECMLLAVKDNDGKYRVVSPDGDVAAGTSLE